MPNPFNIEKILEEQKKKENKKEDREELVRGPTIDGFSSDGGKLTERLEGARDKWAARTKQSRDQAGVTQVLWFTPAH